jgi:hypothetical protein
VLEVVQGHCLGPPGYEVVVLFPGVQPGADPVDGLDLAIDDHAPSRGEGEKCEWPDDAVGEPVVAASNHHFMRKVCVKELEAICSAWFPQSNDKIEIISGRSR